MKKILQPFLGVITWLFFAANASASSPLSNSYTLYEGEETALNSVVGTTRHVFILFSDYAS